jgi:hypothetical protein
MISSNETDLPLYPRFWKTLRMPDNSVHCAGALMKRKETRSNYLMLLCANSHTRLTLPMTIYNVDQIMGVERRDR